MAVGGWPPVPCRTCPRQRALQQPRELGLPEGNVHRVAVRQLVDDAPQGEQRLVDEAALDALAVVHVGLGALAAREVHQRHVGHGAGGAAAWQENANSITRPCSVHLGG